MTYLIYNAIKTPDGTILWCRHNHDFQTHTDTVSGEVYMNDGLGYCYRRSVNKVPYEDLSIFTSDSFEKVRNVKFWHSYGKDGKQPLVILSIAEMETDHIQNILNHASPSKEIIPLFKQELENRLNLNFEKV